MSATVYAVPGPVGLMGSNIRHSVPSQYTDIAYFNKARLRPYSETSKSKVRMNTRLTQRKKATQFAELPIALGEKNISWYSMITGGYHMIIRCYGTTYAALKIHAAL